MDKFIAAHPAEQDGDLMLCLGHGVAYQRDRTHLVQYDEAYFNKCAGYEGQAIAREINRRRCALVAHHYSATGLLLDVGIGSGEFIKWRGRETHGHDVNPVAREWLAREGILAETVFGYPAYTFWDVIEHVPTPADYFDDIEAGCYLFTSLPIFEDLRRIRESKHYRPGEHLYYWTVEGFVDWMHAHGFDWLGIESFEMTAGRESIYSFAFRKVK